MSYPEAESIQVGGKDLQIRPADASDARGWIDLLNEVAREGRFIALDEVSYSRREMARHLRNLSWTAASAAIVAVSSRQVVGQLTMFRERGIYAHTAELGMSITSSFRSGGLGTALMRWALGWASDMAVEKVTLNVFPHNERARRFYEKMGFVEEGLRRRQAKLSYGYEDLIIMARFI